MTKVMINKDVFNVYQLNARELRLYLLICSKQYIKEVLTKEDREYVVGGNNRQYSKEIHLYFKNLCKNNLIEYNQECGGWVSILSEKNFIVFDDLPNIKNLRQLFVLSLNRWYVKYDKDKDSTISNTNPIISKDMFKNLFGNQVREMNRYWKNVCKQLNVQYTWEEQQNTTILIRLNEKQSFMSKIKPIEHEEVVFAEEMRKLFSVDEQGDDVTSCCDDGLFGLVNNSVLF